VTDIHSVRETLAQQLYETFYEPADSSDPDWSAEHGQFREVRRARADRALEVTGIDDLLRRRRALAVDERGIGVHGRIRHKGG
jgi:hypothetical protein